MRLSLVAQRLGELVEQVRIAAGAVGLAVDRGETMTRNAQMNVAGILVEPDADPGIGGLSAVWPSRTPACRDLPAMLAWLARRKIRMSTMGAPGIVRRRSLAYDAVRRLGQLQTSKTVAEGAGASGSASGFRLSVLRIGQKYQ